MSAVSRLRACLLGGGLVMAGFHSGLLPSLQAQETEVTKSSLAKVPADAAFYTAQINLRESVMRLAESPLVQQLRAVPFAVKLEAEFRRQWDDPEGELAQAKGVIESPTAKNLIRLAEDMFANEIFIYGGKDWCEAIEGLLDLQREMQALSDVGQEAILDYLYGLTKEDLDHLKLPTTVIGFRLTDSDNAQVQLDALEGVLRYGLGNVEELKDLMSRLRRKDFDQGQSLSLTLDTSLVPELQLETPEQEEMAQHFLELFEDRRLTLELGVNRGMMLMVLSEGGGIIQQFGKTEDPLLDHEALEMLRNQAPQKLRSISYASQRWRESQWNANFSQYFQKIVNQFTTALNAEGEELTVDQAAWLSHLNQDAEDLDSQLSEMTPEFGPMLAWSYATNKGLEGTMLDWNENKTLANAEPLDIVKYAGDSSLAVLALNSQEADQVQAFVGSLLEKIPGHLTRFIELVEEDEEELEKALMVVEEGWPLIEDAYAILTSQIAPAMGSKTLLTMSADWTVTELPDMPPASKPLPLPEIAVACQLEDRELFVSGCAELYEVMDQMVDFVRKMTPDSVPPDYVVPRPDEELTSMGTRYFYGVIAEQVPLDGFLPQILVGEDLVIVGYSSRQVNEMVAGDTPPLDIAWQPVSKPVAAVSVTNLAGIFAKVRPWAEFAFAMSPVGLDQPITEADGPVPTGNDLLLMWDALSYFGQVMGTTTVSEDGPTVGRWGWQLAE